MVKTFINGKYCLQKTTGVQRFCQNIVMGLDAENYEYHLIQPPRWLNGFIGLFIWEQVVLPYRSRGGLLISLANTGPLFHRNQMLAIHDVAFKENPRWFSRKFQLYYNALIPLLLKRCKKIVTVSEFSKKEIEKHYNFLSSSKISVIDNSVDSSLFNPYLKENKNRSSCKFITVGSLDPRKNLDMTFSAWIKAKDQLPKEAKLLVVGDYNKNIFSDVNLPKDESIVWLGRISDRDLAATYATATALIFPSLYEGFGLPVLEALACGTPVITSIDSAMAEVFDGRGLLVDPKSIEQLTESIVQSYKPEGPTFDLEKSIAIISRYSTTAPALSLINIIES